MIRRAAIDDVGAPSFEPEFFAYYEDTDFFARALRRGWRLYYTGPPSAWHRVRGSTADQPYRYFYLMERNRLLFAYRHLPGGPLRSLLRQTRRAAVRELAKHPIRWLGGKDDEARARRDARLWVVRHRSTCLEQRRRANGGDCSYLAALRRLESRARYYDHPRPEIAALIPSDARTVIDVGCASGALGKALKADRPGLQVFGIEPMPEPAARARAVLDRLLEGSATDPLPAGWPAPDCVVLADMLEHTEDPWRVLRLWKERLAPGGTVVLSLPNVAHRSVVTDLLRGRWEYVDAGILDRTHLRFFTRHTVIELVENAGLRVVRLDRLVDEGAERAVRRQAIRWFARAAGPAAARVADWHTLQFLLVAR
jgi:SAM-dependent methyltransferase